MDLEIEDLHVLDIDDDLKTYLDGKKNANKNDDERFEAEIVKEGRIRDSLLVWEHEGKKIIVDGHRRYEVAHKHGLKFRYETKEFESIEEVKLWMDTWQYIRRNLSDAKRKETMGRLGIERKKKAGAPKKAENTGENNKGHDDLNYSGRNSEDDKSAKTTASEVAKEQGVSEKSVKRAIAATELHDEVAKIDPGLAEKAFEIPDKDVADVRRTAKAAADKVSDGKEYMSAFMAESLSRKLRELDPPEEAITDDGSDEDDPLPSILADALAGKVVDDELEDAIGVIDEATEPEPDEKQDDSGDAFMLCEPVTRKEVAGIVERLQGSDPKVFTLLLKSMLESEGLPVESLGPNSIDRVLLLLTASNQASQAKVVDALFGAQTEAKQERIVRDYFAPKTEKTQKVLRSVAKINLGAAVKRGIDLRDKPGSVEEVVEHAEKLKRGGERVDAPKYAKRFFHHFESKGWMIEDGKPVIDWRARLLVYCGMVGGETDESRRVDVEYTTPTINLDERKRELSRNREKANA